MKLDGETWFRQLLEAAPDAMVIADVRGVIVLVNAQAETLFGYSRDEMLGRPVEILIPARYRDVHPRYRDGYFHEPRKRPMGAGGLALFGRRKDGSEFPAEISLSPFAAGDEMLAITTVRDITERKQAEEDRAKRLQAEEALRLRDEFLSIASHELKTPLTSLIMQLDSVARMQARASTPEERARVVTKVAGVRASAGRMAKLVDQLLDLSRITSGRLTLEREDVDLVLLVRSVVAELHDEAARAGCAIRVEVPERPVVGSWDSLRLQQILTNLISNAIKYGAGKPIEVRVEPEERGFASLVVQDHGIGIAPEHQARIFERFERVVSQKNFGGFGLGLWIVRQIIEAHGGRIGIWSQPGAGAMFKVELPVRREESALKAIERGRVMLVDDDPMIRESFKDALEEEGYRVILSSDGQDALDTLRSTEAPCLIFLDLMMPEMDGVTFRSEQQKDPKLADIPVVVLSASTAAERVAKSIGAAGCVPKPMALDQLLELIAVHCPCGTAPPQPHA